MGIAKRMWEEEQGRGYSLNKGKTVCTECFEDYGIKKFIIKSNTHSSCSYCEVYDDIVACSLDELIEHLLTSIYHEWGDPANEGLPYETREGGWQVASVNNTWELFFNAGLNNVHGETLDDICDAIHNQEWCEKNPYSLSGDKTLLFGWNKFSDFVKSKARYVFLKDKNPDYDEDQHDEMDPVDILSALETITKKIGLVKTVEPTTQIHRVRIVDPNIDLKTAKELGSPSNDLAKMANRMSPAGISMFYGAFDIDTAIKETYDPCDANKKAISGIFEPVRALSVIDLSEGLYIPSLFDEDERDNRDYMSFLFDFVEDFTKPIERSDRAHVDYVPTQVVTEYIRHIFTDTDDSPIDGVIYPSSKNEGQKAIVIFATSSQCVEIAESSEEGAMLKLVDIETKSLNRISASPSSRLVHKTQTKDGHAVWPFDYSFDLTQVNCPRCLELIKNGE